MAYMYHNFFMQWHICKSSFQLKYILPALSCFCYWITVIIDYIVYFYNMFFYLTFFKFDDFLMM